MIIILNKSVEISLAERASWQKKHIFLRETIFLWKGVAEVIVHSLFLKVLSVTLRSTFSCFQRIPTNAWALGSAEVEEESCSRRWNIWEWAREGTTREYRRALKWPKCCVSVWFDFSCCRCRVQWCPRRTENVPTLSGQLWQWSKSCSVRSLTLALSCMRWATLAPPHPQGWQISEPSCKSLTLAEAFQNPLNWRLSLTDLCSVKLKSVSPNAARCWQQSASMTTVRSIPADPGVSRNLNGGQAWSILYLFKSTTNVVFQADFYFIRGWLILAPGRPLSWWS